MKALPKILLALTAVAALSLAYPASVQAVPTTYVYTGNPFTNVNGPYTTTDFVTVMLTFAEPLASNLLLSFVFPISFTFSDGVQTITDQTFSFAFFQVATGPTGAITGWRLLAVSQPIGSIASFNAAVVKSPLGVPPLRRASHHPHQRCT